MSGGAPQEIQTIKKVGEKSNNQNPTNTTFEFPSHSLSVIKTINGRRRRGCSTPQPSPGAGAGRVDIIRGSRVWTAYRQPPSRLTSRRAAKLSSARAQRTRPSAGPAHSGATAQLRRAGRLPSSNPPRIHLQGTSRHGGRPPRRPRPRGGVAVVPASTSRFSRCSLLKGRPGYYRLSPGFVEPGLRILRPKSFFSKFQKYSEGREE